ncbi:[protein-PII] uridylyltransferase [Psychrobium sp. 1_MG-2023]|uniref:[protein-PII] uridylyltransferase n=1 Tax=Psychrobium sp. 1_MG-2023 TaxID=3062624 RepID=UPI000C33968E|nr:[protein-PII] uridylyltransferase [Psychrobium sp. 1_MG-2023]MDP2559998.1 [protein-PII] uridylyltransferase [Psychrobium sp. 1_MG-2023]PKF56340.1 [protein-PII] uridylyltransferase [Alteromonadales bacterium alter-6D02]
MLAAAKPLSQLSPPELISHFKQHIQQFSQQATQQFNQHVDIRTLLHQRSHCIDDVLKQLWQHFTLDQDNIALIAVGGYGRSELHPNSDIDLLLLAKKTVTPAQCEKISQFITLLWDIKLDIGHSVRTLKETLSIGQDDITVATNLMESRLLCGELELYDELQVAIEHPRFWPSSEFYIAKRDEQIERHSSTTSFDLEPNIKGCAGGLRDIQTIGWIAKRHFKATFVEQLVAHGFLSKDELVQLLACQDFLWRMRFALHNVANRGEDKLLFNYQHDVALALGFSDSQQLAVEKMMKQYYQTVRQVRELSEMLLQLFKREFLGRIKPLDIINLNELYQRRGQFVEAKKETIFEQPQEMINIFLNAAIDPEINGVYAPTLRLLRQARHELEQPLCENIDCRKAFMNILKHPNGINALSLMHKHGILASYLPAWEKISGQMQFDLFHAYTVDEHTHRLLLNIQRFSQPEHKEEFPLCSVLINTLSKKGLLVLAAIFHDIGKGRGGDHSELGAQDALEFGPLHGLNNHDTRLVSWLVENHLMMSITAQRRDIHDPDVINEFAKAVKDETRLAYLYCLTVADICATNNNLWNNWKGSLLRELYFYTLRALRRGKMSEVDADERIDEYKSKALQIINNREQTTVSQEQVSDLWQTFQPDYFLRHTPVAIAKHTQTIIESETTSKPLIALFNYDKKNSSELFVYTQDKINLFAKVMRVLGSKNVQINDAHVMATNHGYALDTFTISELDGSAVTEPRRIKSIVQTLNKSLTVKSFKPHSKRRIARQVKHFNVPTRVSFIDNDNDSENNDYTIFELVALDVPGLLATIGDVFTKQRITLINAKITTIGERVEDFFIIADEFGHSLGDAKKQTLQQSLLKAIEKINQ